MNKRTPFIITVRCTLNGADTTSLLYLRDPVPVEGLEAMKRRVPKHERNSLRIVECREATAPEIFAHKARIAEWR